MMDRRQFILSLLAAATHQLLVPPAGSAGENPLLRIAVISDLNHSYGSIGYDPPVRAAIRRVSALKPDIVLCTGDMIGGQRTAPKLNRQRLEAMWQAFHETITLPLADAGIPFAPSAGNHDASASPGFQLERDIFREQWPKNRSSVTLLGSGDYPFHYGFILKGVLFAALDATVAGPISTSQRTWLVDLLAEHGTKSRDRIVFGHLPNWPITVGREQGILKDTELEQLFIDQSVSVYLSGHQHGFYPFYHNGQYYVGQAALGSGPRRLIGTTKRSPRAVTFLEISEDGTLTVTAYTGPEFNKVLPRSALPAKISANGSTIVRDDLNK